MRALTKNDWPVESGTEPQVSIELNNQKRHRHNHKQQRLKGEAEIVTRGEHDATVRAQDDVNLILKQAEREQVSLKAIFCDVDCLLVRGVAKDDYHDQADDQ